MSKQMMWIIGAVVLLLIGGFLFMQMNQSTTQTTETPSTQSTNPTPVVESSPATTSGETSGTVKKFTVTGSPFKFEPTTMTVNQGDTVEINFVNSAGIHDIVIDEFDARTRQINAGESQTITFVANKTGTFEYYCSVGNHRAQGMVGTLTVQ